MESEVLYGFDTYYEQIKNIFLSGKMPSSWIIYGQKHSGKFSFSKKIIRSLISYSICGEFKDLDRNHIFYNQIEKLSFADLLIIGKEQAEDKKQEISVDEIRKINQFMRLSPASGKYKFVIIDNACQMNVNAANALLKILEEPPSNSFIFLISHIYGKMLPTIKSRCAKLPIIPMNEEITKIIAKEKNIDIEHIDPLIELAGSNIGKIIYFEENDALSFYEEFLNLITDVQNLDYPFLTSFAEKNFSKQEDKWSLFVDLFDHLLLNLTRFASNINEITWVCKKEETIVKTLAPMLDIEELIDFKFYLLKTNRETIELYLDKTLTFVVILNNFRKILK